MDEVTEVSARFCNHCGEPQIATARFCGDCGQPMLVVTQVIPQTLHTAPADEVQPPPTRWSAGKLMVAYAIAMALLYLSFKFEWPTFGMLVYMFSSVFLTRVLYRDVVEFHPMHNTLGNMVAQKVLTLILWPIRVPLILFQLAFNDAL